MFAMPSKSCKARAHCLTFSQALMAELPVMTSISMLLHARWLRSPKASGHLPPFSEALLAELHEQMSIWMLCNYGVH
jgi:hypothetical protein